MAHAGEIAQFGGLDGRLVRFGFAAGHQFRELTVEPVLDAGAVEIHSAFVVKSVVRLSRHEVIHVVVREADGELRLVAARERAPPHFEANLDARLAGKEGQQQIVDFERL